LTDCFMRPNPALTLTDARLLGTRAVYLGGLRLSDGELLIVASDRFEPAAIGIYGLRWGIETLFGCLKGRGFKLEETRVVGYLRIKELLVLPAVAFCCHKIGEWEHDCVLPIKIKAHQRRAQSLFRYGLDAIRPEILNPFARSMKLLMKMISLLRPVYPEHASGNAIPDTR
jgi:hypothetical protein